MYLNAYGNFRTYQPWRRFRDRMRGLMVAIRRWEFDYLADHSMNRYVEYIQRAVQDEESGRIKPVPKLPPTLG